MRPEVIAVERMAKRRRIRPLLWCRSTKNVWHTQNTVAGGGFIPPIATQNAFQNAATKRRAKQRGARLGQAPPPGEM